MTTPPKPFQVIAGPCSIDSAQTYLESAAALKKLGATGLRGALFKMRTRPEDFQGVGLKGIEILQQARNQIGLPIVTEVVDARHLEALDPWVDQYQVGARSMYNYELLKELGRAKKPVLLKRAFTATLDEWVNASEYIRKSGNAPVTLCERGIRSFDPSTRNVLDLAIVPLAKMRTGLPVWVDPSHGTGRRELVTPMALAAAAVGADGLLIEVHPDSSQALSDADQALSLDDFALLMKRLRPILDARSATLD